jgi:hypothetical protein
VPVYTLKGIETETIIARLERNGAQYDYPQIAGEGRRVCRLWRTGLAIALTVLSLNFRAKIRKQRIFAAVAHALTLPASGRPRKIKDVMHKNVVFSVAYRNAARNFTRP